MPVPKQPAPSPWRGSFHETEHRWQLERVSDLAAAVGELWSLVAELRAAQAAGWSLAEPMRSGHLLAVRPSRRRRAQLRGPSAPAGPVGAGPRRRWRVRLVDEPPVAGDEVLCLDTAEQTAALTWAGGGLRQVGGPAVPSSMLGELTRQLSAAEAGHRQWGIAPARVGPNVDLVADGSALRIHTVDGGALVRVIEVLTFQHAADGAATLLEAAAAYDRLAKAAEAMAAVGGRLIGTDDGMLHVRYVSFAGCA